MDTPDNFVEENEKYIAALKDLPRTNSIFGSQVFTKEVACLLFGMGLEKYMDIFKSNNISLELFLSLTEDDLKILGIEDENDCSTIIRHNSLTSKVQDASSSTQAMTNDLSDDLLIAHNLLSHSTSLNSSLTFLLRKLSNYNLTDYYVSQEYNAKQLLDIVCAKAIQQSDINSKLIHSSDGLIESILLAEDLKLTPALKSKLDGRRVIRKKRLAMVLLVSTGICSLAIFANSYFS